MRLKTIVKRGAGLLLYAVLALSHCLPVSAAGGAGYTDLRGHWAESQLQWAHRAAVRAGFVKAGAELRLRGLCRGEKTEKRFDEKVGNDLFAA